MREEDGMLDRAEQVLPYAATTRKRRQFRWGLLAVHAGLICVCAGFILPFIWMVSTSLKTTNQTTEFPPRFVPTPWQPENYVAVFKHPNFHMLLYTRNTLVIALLCVAGVTLSSAVVAYGF